MFQNCGYKICNLKKIVMLHDHFEFTFRLKKKQRRFRQLNINEILNTNLTKWTQRHEDSKIETYLITTRT